MYAPEKHEGMVDVLPPARVLHEDEGTVDVLPLARVSHEDEQVQIGVDGKHLNAKVTMGSEETKILRQTVALELEY